MDAHRSNENENEDEQSLTPQILDQDCNNDRLDRYPPAQRFATKTQCQVQRISPTEVGMSCRRPGVWRLEI